MGLVGVELFRDTLLDVKAMRSVLCPCPKVFIYHNVTPPPPKEKKKKERNLNTSDPCNFKLLQEIRFSYIFTLVCISHPHSFLLPFPPVCPFLFISRSLSLSPPRITYSSTTESPPPSPPSVSPCVSCPSRYHTYPIIQPFHFLLSLFTLTTYSLPTAVACLTLSRRPIELTLLALPSNGLPPHRSSLMGPGRLLR